MNDQEPWAHCNRCGAHTRHATIYETKIVSDDDVGRGQTVTTVDQYTLMKCNGCDTVHLKHDSTFSEFTDAEGNLEVSTVIYPPRISRKMPDWLNGWDTPFDFDETRIKSFLTEIYAAMHNGSLQLAAMGIRALVEHIMVEKVGDKGSFDKNIQAFFDAGFVAPHSQTIFRDNLIEAGHAAMHRGYSPESSDLKTLLDITETLIATIYIHPSRAAALNERIPKRKD